MNTLLAKLENDTSLFLSFAFYVVASWICFCQLIFYYLILESDYLKTNFRMILDQTH